MSLGHPGKAVFCLVTLRQTLHVGPYLLCLLLRGRRTLAVRGVRATDRARPVS